MEKILNFIIENWRLLAECLAGLVAFILFLCRKRPVNDVWSYIYQVCLVAIDKAELIQGKGSDKLQYAVEYVVEAIHQKYPDCNAHRYVRLIEQTIELILSTPQKKER